MDGLYEYSFRPYNPGSYCICTISGLILSTRFHKISELYRHLLPVPLSSCTRLYVYLPTPPLIGGYSGEIIKYEGSQMRMMMKIDLKYLCHLSYPSYLNYYSPYLYSSDFLTSLFASPQLDGMIFILYSPLVSI